MLYTQSSVIASLQSLQFLEGDAFITLFNRVNDGDLETLFTFEEWETVCMDNGWS